MYEFALTVMFFGLYAFGGWIWELIFNLVFHRRLRLHGFLTLPLLPIYGFSALAIIALVQPYFDNPFLVFLASAGLVTAVEYISSFSIEKLFQIRLWDYEDWPFDLFGRISLFSTLGFGVMGLFLIYVLQPFFSGFIYNVPAIITMVTGWALFLLVVIDFGNQVSALVRIRRADGSLDDIQLKLEQSIAMLASQGKKARANFNKWYRFNLRHLRHAYPGARRTGGKK